MLHAMIMAGGGGTRFWPWSRSQRPKQFMTLNDDRSLLQESFDRLEGQVPIDQIWVITAGQHKKLVLEQLPRLSKEKIVGEPCGRDTAACIGLGAALIAREDPDGVMIVTPADHMIQPEQEFRRAISAAAQIADEHPAALVTLGIPPAFPATGYGYIHRGAAVETRQGISVCHVQSFKEKPPLEIARQYLAAGGYYWNSGIFVWRVQTILDALNRNQPEIYDAANRIADAWGTPNQNEVFQQEYNDLNRLSIDYAVMEKAEKVLVLQAPFKWDDVGSWNALERIYPQDADGNTVLAFHTGLETRDCIIAGEAEKLVTTVGVTNLLIVQDRDAILIADKNNENAVRMIVEKLKEKGLEGHL